MSWKTTQPPKRKVKPMTLRYKQDGHATRRGNFVWSDRENTWIECVAGDGIALYEEDGWKVISWLE